MKKDERPFFGAAAAALAFPVLLPIYNNDVYWHLSAGRRILELGRVPKEDWLSSSRAGAPWIDFEWLAQVLYYCVHAAGGFFALWLLKALLVAALARLAWAAIRLRAPEGPAAPAALALWAAALLPFADLRPDLFSALGFSLVFLAAERGRLGKRVPHPAWALPLFALWANLHAGWPYGLALLALYRRWAALAAAAAGVCLQPGGPASISVVFEHGRDLALIGRHILEWRPAAWDHPWLTGFFFLLAAAGAGLIGLLARRRRPAWEPALAAAAAGAAAFKHARLALFFPGPAAACAADWTGALLSGRRLRWACGLACAAALIAAAPISLEVGTFRRVLRPSGVEGAAAYLDERAAELGGRAVYAHAWQWGSYLGWKLYPRYKVFGDGRYLFHGLVEASRAATQTPELWSRFLDEHALDLVILEARGPVPDYWRPYMPEARWSLAYADDRALLFVRQRGAKRR